MWVLSNSCPPSLKDRRGLGQTTSCFQGIGVVSNRLEGHLGVFMGNNELSAAKFCLLGLCLFGYQAHAGNVASSMFFMSFFRLQNPRLECETCWVVDLLDAKDGHAPV